MSTIVGAETQQQGLQCFHDGQLDEALHLLGDSVSEGESSERWNDWAVAQLAAHNVAVGEKALRRALKLQPENLRAAANLGAVLATLGRTDEAIPLLVRSWPALAPDDKANVARLLALNRVKSEAPASASAFPAPDTSPQIAKLLSMQTTALNSVALRMIATEGALDRLSKSFTGGQAVELNGRTRSVASHFMHRPNTSYIVPAAAAEGYTQDDGRLVERAMAAYQFSAAEFESFRDSMWREFFDQRQQANHLAFMGNDTQQAAAILRDPASTDLFYGFDNLTSSTVQKTLVSGDHNTIMDHLVRLAEAIGAQRLDNPMAYLFRGDAPTVLDATAVNTVVERIEKAIGCTLSFPNPYPDEFGVLTSRGIVSYRAVSALYQACRIKQLLKGVARPRVLEIGGGLGRVAYFARLLGIRDYTIIDIPMTAISQGYFLGRVLGEDAIQLAGEHHPHPETRVKVFPPSQFLSASDHYDIVLNADSFVEFGESVAQNYWKQIEARAEIFLSINHESNPYTVRQFIESSPRVDTCDRHPYWIHVGYVEETVRFKHNKA